MKIKVSNILGALGCIAASYVVYKIGKIYLIRKKYRHIPGPPTKGIKGFFFGNTSDLEDYYAIGKIDADFYYDCFLKYGQVFKYQILEEIMVFTLNPDAIKEIYVTKNYPFAYESFFNLFNERFLGIGLALDSNMERWKKRRAIFNHGFHRNMLMKFVDKFNSKADILMERLRGFADGKTVVELFNEFSHAAFDAIADIAFGLHLDSISGKDIELFSALSLLQKSLMESIYDPLMAFKPNKREKIKKTRETIKYFRNVCRNVIEERLNKLKNQEFSPNDILTNIMQNWNDEELDIEIMIDDMIAFFSGGQDSTASVLSSCFLELGRNPILLKKAREEIDEKLGNRNEITFQDVVDLKYISYIFKETLRLHVPFTNIVRRNTDELNINDYKIPKDTKIVISPYVSGRNEAFFDKPLEYNPSRFIEKSFENYTYIPFSTGPRNCIGQNFAQLEATIFMAKLIQNFDFKLDSSQLFTFDNFSGSLKPTGGTKCILELRS